MHGIEGEDGRVGIEGLRRRSPGAECQQLEFHGVPEAGRDHNALR